MIRWIVAILLFSASVSALAIIPHDDGSIDLDTGDEYELTFSVVNGPEKQRVELFALCDESVLCDGEVNYSNVELLDEYEEEEFIIELDARKEAIVEIVYGVKSEKNDSLDFREGLQATIDVDIDGRPVDTLISSDPRRRSSTTTTESSEDVPAQQEEERELTVVLPSEREQEQNKEEEGIQTDISAVVIPPEPQITQRQQISTVGDELPVRSENSKIVASIFIGLLLGTVMVNMFAIKIAKEVYG